jgi:hypothetical protein
MNQVITMGVCADKAAPLAKQMSTPGLPFMNCSLTRVQCLHRAARLPPQFSVIPNQRWAMMSALSRESRAPPVVMPSTRNLPLDAFSPQTAARPPSAPKPEKTRPTLKATKAALSIVSVTIFFMFRNYLGV